MSLGKLGESFASFGFSLPLPAVDHVFSGFEFLGVILVTAIPFGIYDLVEAMDNVESAAAAGDGFPTTRVLTADGVVSLIGCLMGNPFINAVYIGHPGWKAMGGRIGYSAATGVMVIVLSWFGIISLMLGADPGRRDLADPALHRHADRRAGVPGDAEAPRAGDRAGARAAPRRLGQDCMIDGALGAAGTSAAAVGFDKLGRERRALPGARRCWAAARSSPAWCWARSAVFVIDRKFTKAAAFALAGAVLTFFGFMHGEAIGVGYGFGVTPGVTLAYAAVAAFLFGCARYGEVQPFHDTEPAHGHDALAQPAE